MELSQRFRRTLATAFTILVVTGGLTVLGHSWEVFVLGLIPALIWVGRELILHGPSELPPPSVLVRASVIRQRQQVHGVFGAFCLVLLPVVLTLLAVGPFFETLGLLVTGMMLGAALAGYRVALVQLDRGYPLIMDRGGRRVEPQTLLHHSLRELAGLQGQILVAAKARGMASVLAGPLAEVERLVEVHERLAQEQTTVIQHLHEHPIAELELEILSLGGRLAGATEAVRGLLQQNIEILELRRDKLVALRSSMEVSRAQRNVIEDSLKLLHDQILAASTPDDLREPLSRLTTNLRATEAILAETRGLLETR